MERLKSHRMLRGNRQLRFALPVHGSRTRRDGRPIRLIAPGMRTAWQEKNSAKGTTLESRRRTGHDLDAQRGNATAAVFDLSPCRRGVCDQYSSGERDYWV